MTDSPAPTEPGPACASPWPRAAAATSWLVTKLDRLDRSMPDDGRAIAEELTAREFKLSIGGSVHDPTDPVGRPLFNALAMLAEFEAR